MENDEKQMTLLQKFLNKEELDTEELKMLFKQYNSEKGNAEIEDFLEKYWFRYQEPDWQEVNSEKILSEINASIRDKQYRSVHQLKVIYQWTTVAAAVFLAAILTAGSFFLDIRLKQDQVADLTEVNAPGGKVENFYLPDGTHVWLNPGSSLIYSGDMENEKIRDVRLWGQAFFEVAKDKKHPFILQLGDIGLKVTGTSFNASNYKDDPHVEVVLKTGQINLFRGFYQDATDFVKLTPGQMAKYKKGDTHFEVQQVDVEKYTAWMNGILMFRDDLMSDVFRQLERWYDVKIIVHDQKINNYLYTATIQNESLEQILKLLEYTSQLKCKMIKNNNSETLKPTVLITTKNS